MYNFRQLFPLFILFAACFSCNKVDISQEIREEMSKLPDQLDYNQHVKPILSDKCFACHGPDKATISAGLQLHQRELAYSELVDHPGKYAIVPGKLGKSQVIARILTQDPDLVMPKPESHLTLSNYEKAVLIQWIKDGAEYKSHWAFLPLDETLDGEDLDKNQYFNPIDKYVQRKWKENQLHGNPLADKETILRRLSFDITGLPPSAEEISAFLMDTSVHAYEKQVDRLLSSPQYGEQMTLRWMDLARFADTHGYSVDRYRDMSPWRDWVINAFNENMGYDEFVEWQLAGDLMDNPSKDMVLATGFNRIHPQNMEGGIVNEEFLIEYAADRASTFGQAFLGLTVACARCHDHKYDPISHKNFYELTSYFNNVNESGQISWNNAMPVPTMLLPTEEQEAVIDFLESEITKQENKRDSLIQRVVREEAVEWISNQGYNELPKEVGTAFCTAYFPLDKDLSNTISPKVVGDMANETGGNKKIEWSEGKKGSAILFNGDNWLNLGGEGVFGRHESFSVGFWIHLPADLKDGNIFHKGDGAILYNWRGYHLRIVGQQLEMMLAHTAPDNAIVKYTMEDVPREQWIYLTMTYDGSSKAKGLRLYLNGEEMATETKVDNLYKDILFHRQNEPGLQFGARYRGKGIKGAMLDEVRVYNKKLTEMEIRLLATGDSDDYYPDRPPEALSQDEKQWLTEYYIERRSDKLEKNNQALQDLRKRYVDSMEVIQEVMVMKEKEEAVQAFVLERGAYDSPSEKVYPNTPEVFLPIPDQYPNNRLGLAKWLFHPDHPLTARVAVNRIWQDYFGRGLVETSEDFGNQGSMPSHPKLLDYLAKYFQDSGWDLKAVQKHIVMSYAYRQSSISEEGHPDIENIWLCRGPVKRLSGEMLRDQVLKASGLLNATIGGKSVKPYQPAGLWRVNGSTYVADKGESLYRRSMYTLWKRSVPHPTIASFDAPARDVCVIRRQETNTPLQALVLLNDPIYIESARVMGSRFSNYPNAEAGIVEGFLRLTGRNIKSEEMDILLKLYGAEVEKFQNYPKKMKGWLTMGDSSVADDHRSAATAAMAVVMNTIMNSDASIMLR
ncbi:DUF1553 domain-containing protein [Membranihabitans marinus]|uniref:DUF1553 domain-containing protein n=1 Tax=Membranihabitans marinus TaxID=1227546 RepID=UPI001F2D8AF6|nr:DUF1553 domain-containing protein [Membranihabitans marinus]